MKRMIMKHKKLAILALCALLLLCLGAGVLYYRSTPAYLLAREGSLELLADDGTDGSSNSGKTTETDSDRDSVPDDGSHPSGTDADASSSETESSASNSSSSDSKEEISEDDPVSPGKDTADEPDHTNPSNPGNPGASDPDAPESSDPGQKPEVIYPHRPYELPFIAAGDN